MQKENRELYDSSIVSTSTKNLQYYIISNVLNHFVYSFISLLQSKGSKLELTLNVGFNQINIASRVSLYVWFTNSAEKS